ncbi:MAG: tetratricopeptide repeat protein [Candidatus Aminicenantaceae bacterium]
MKKLSILTAVCILFSLSFASALPQSAHDLFQKGLAKERAEGNLEEAIQLYEKVVKTAKDKALAAKAQLRIGFCFEKLGLKEAQKAFQKVIDNYPNQAEAVKTAREKLALLLKAQAIVEKGEKELRIRKICSTPETGMGEISPDGQYLSFVDWGTGNLAILETATGKTRNLTKWGWSAKPSGYPQTSRWSPDSKQVVYQWLTEPNALELRIVGLDGSEPRTLYRIEEKNWIEPTDWSPDGKYILAKFFEGKDSCKLGLISVADGSVRIINTLEYFTPSLGIGVHFSPDGRYIAYDFPKNGNSLKFDIFLMSSDGSNEVPLTTHPSHDSLLGWSPDGKAILFISKRTGTLDIWSTQVAEGKPQGTPQLVRRNIGSIEPRGITKQGSLYFNTPRMMYDIYTATLDPDTGKIIKPPAKFALPYEGNNYAPAWSPDGKFLAYVSNRDRKYFFCIYSLETEKIRELTFKHNLTFPRWFPDGRSILVQATVGSGQGIHRIDTQTGEAALVINRGEGEFLQSAQVSPDGKSIFYIKENDSKKFFQILVRDIKTGKEKEILRTPPFDNNTIALSPDGKRLAVLMSEEENIRVLKIIPASGGELREIHRFKQGGRWFIDIAWSPDGQYIYFYKSIPKDWKWELWRIPSKGGKAQDLGLRMGRYMHLNVHPDGKHLVFAAYTKESLSQELWVMENFLPKKK